jgi:hypothetical protein
MKTIGQATLCGLTLGVLLLGCRTADDVGRVLAIEGVRNPSIHVLFDTTRALPVAGTFGWGISLLRVDPAQKVLLSEVEERLHRSLLGALPVEGFTYTNQAPDYLVGFAFLGGASLNEAELNASYGSLLSFPARNETSPSLNYGTGVLILDIVETARGHLLWRGAIKADIDLDLPDAKKQARCDGAIHELLRHYPVPTPSR